MINGVISIYDDTKVDYFKYTNVKAQGISIEDDNNLLEIYMGDNKIDELIELLQWLKTHNWYHRVKK